MGGGGEERRWQISGGCPAGPSVCHQKIEFICVIQMLMLSSPRLCLCVLLSQRKGLARWGGGRWVWWRRWRWGASSHPLGSFCTCIKENGHGLMTTLFSHPDSINRNMYWQHVHPYCGSRKYLPIHFLIICFRDKPSIGSLETAQVDFLSLKWNWSQRESKSWIIGGVECWKD